MARRGLHHSPKSHVLSGFLHWLFCNQNILILLNLHKIGGSTTLRFPLVGGADPGLGIPFTAAGGDPGRDQPEYLPKWTPGMCAHLGMAGELFSTQTEGRAVWGSVSPVLCHRRHYSKCNANEFLFMLIFWAIILENLLIELPFLVHLGGSAG